MTSLPTAYCAPGRRMISALTLMLEGEQVAEIVEHPWLAGKTEILIVAPAVFDLPEYDPGDFQCPPRLTGPLVTPPLSSLLSPHP